MSLAELPSPPRTMTAEELLKLPDDGIDREIYRGELQERLVTRRSRPHSRTEARIAKLLANWNDACPAPRGEVLCGEAAFRLSKEPDTFVGIDVAYASAALAAATDPKARFFDGPPTLAVEVLSPSDTHENIVAKVELYLAAGSVVWVVDPDFCIVVVHRPGVVSESFNVNQELSGEPYLPGFRVRVADIFA